MPAHIQQGLSIMLWTKIMLMYCHGQQIHQISVRLSMFGMRWSANYVSCLSSRQTYDSLLELSSRCGPTSHKTFIHMSLAQWGEDAQLWSMHVGDTHNTDLVTSIYLSTFSATSANMKMAFCKFQVQLTISEMSWTSITRIFQWLICHGWKNIAHFTMHNFLCCRVYLYMSDIIWPRKRVMYIWVLFYLMVCSAICRCRWLYSQIFTHKLNDVLNH